MQTPWGKAQQTDKHTTYPIYWVSTASHGGYMIGSSFIKDTPLADIGEKWGNWYAFEEDCLSYAVELYCWKDPTFRSFFNRVFGRQITRGTLRSGLRCLKFYYPKIVDGLLGR